MISKREYKMLKTFNNTRFWRGIPATAEKLLGAGMIKPTAFGWGNYMITESGREAVKQFEQVIKGA